MIKMRILPIFYLETGLNVTVAHGAFAVILPKGTFPGQVDLVKPKEVIGEEAF